MQLSPQAGPFYRRTLMFCGLAALMMLVLLMLTLEISPAPLLLSLGVVALLWFANKKTTSCIGFFLFIMPMYPLLFLIAKFFGPSYIGSLEGIDRGVLLLLTAIMLLHNRIKLVRADWLILTAFCIAVLRLPLDGSALALAADFGFMIAYFAGRATVLSEEQQNRWANRAVWVLAVISVGGLFEVFVLGEGPRTLLYMRTAEQYLWNGVALNASFHATGFGGIRESGTMIGPLQFGPLCMVALLLWWVYSRKPIPGIMILLGLVCAISRAAWVGFAVAMVMLALQMGQKKHLLLYGTLALAVLLAAIPFIGLGDYIASNQEGTDVSAGQHQESLLLGVTFVAQHPLGQGTENVGRQAEKSNPDAIYFEDAYLTLSGGYGIPVVLCLIGFFVELIRTGLKSRTKLGFAVFGILAGFGTVLMFLSVHDVFPVVCWIWFPAGLLVTQEERKRAQGADRGLQQAA